MNIGTILEKHPLIAFMFSILLNTGGFHGDQTKMSPALVDLSDTLLDPKSLSFDDIIPEFPGEPPADNYGSPDAFGSPTSSNMHLDDDSRK